MRCSVVRERVSSWDPRDEVGLGLESNHAKVSLGLSASDIKTAVSIENLARISLVEACAGCDRFTPRTCAGASKIELRPEEAFTS